MNKMMTKTLIFYLIQIVVLAGGQAARPLLPHSVLNRTLAALFLPFLLFLPISLWAQDDGGLPIQSDWDTISYSTYAFGDQTFTMSIGGIFPLAFIADGETLENNADFGGTGFLSYNYFLGPRLFLGAEFGGMFSSTLGKNYLFIIPYGLRVGYQFILGRFEFPLALLAGGATHKYLDYDYFGPFVKPSASAFFRLNADWSFGLNAAWWLVFETGTSTARDSQGHFLEITASARYHF
jgi:hypothetical protein